MKGEYSHGKRNLRESQWNRLCNRLSVNLVGLELTGKQRANVYNLQLTFESCCVSQSVKVLWTVLLPDSKKATFGADRKDIRSTRLLMTSGVTTRNDALYALCLGNSTDDEEAYQYYVNKRQL